LDIAQAISPGSGLSPAVWDSPVQGTWEVPRTFGFTFHHPTLKSRWHCNVLTLFIQTVM
jgi:hypothetical protein